MGRRDTCRGSVREGRMNRSGNAAGFRLLGYILQCIQEGGFLCRRRIMPGMIVFTLGAAKEGSLYVKEGREGYE